MCVEGWGYAAHTLDEPLPVILEMTVAVKKIVVLMERC
jgi:hypothetical protein